jgi:hypothetical protein
LDTIIDSDRVLVMNAGLLAEFDSPYNLLTKQDSIFASLCRQSGPGQYELLLGAAVQHERTMEALKERVAEVMEDEEYAVLIDIEEAGAANQAQIV